VQLILARFEFVYFFPLLLLLLTGDVNAMEMDDAAEAQES